MMMIWSVDHPSSNEQPVVAAGYDVDCTLLRASKLNPFQIEIQKKFFHQLIYLLIERRLSGMSLDIVILVHSGIFL